MYYQAWWVLIYIYLYQSKCQFIILNYFVNAIKGGCQALMCLKKDEYYYSLHL